MSFKKGRAQAQGCTGPEKRRQKTPGKKGVQLQATVRWEVRRLLLEVMQNARKERTSSKNLLEKGLSSQDATVLVESWSSKKKTPPISIFFRGRSILMGN